MSIPLLDRARAWIQADCDPQTAALAEELLSKGDPKQLASHFDGLLEFGTAGLRAEVGAGPMRMNAAVVRVATWAVAQYLKTQQHKSGSSVAPVLVLGYDARLSSRYFAEQAAGVLTAYGIDVVYFEEAVATPIAAFALLHYKASAAIVITASHNPPQYNGYKLYAANGAQIISPTDAEIATAMTKAPPAKDIVMQTGALDGSIENAKPVARSVIDLYFDTIDALRPKQSGTRDIKVVYTPMHGVGGAPVKRALASAGFTNISFVKEQFEPDGHFPTVNFPNPEEPGAMDLAFAEADRTGSELVIANDPDVDRLAAAVRTERGMLALSGNQIGLLLADYQLSRYLGTAKPMVLQSIVSSPMLASIAEAYAAHFEQTLTGFKWVWNAALALRAKAGYHFVFGFEEALGYSAEDIVRDKDGISAALLFVEMAAAERSAGSSVRQRLERLYRKHGLWISVQRSITRASADGIREIQEAVTRIGKNPPTSLDGITVSEVRDFRTGQENRPAWLENSPLIELRLGQSGRVLVRPSGTEPKLKIYVDLCEPVGASEDVWQKEVPAAARAKKIADEVMKQCGF